MEIEGFDSKDLDWTSEPIIGAVLTMNHKEMFDSYGVPIDNSKKYLVAKHLPSGMLIIIDAELDYKKKQLEHNLKLQGRLN